MVNWYYIPFFISGICILLAVIFLIIAKCMKKKTDKLSKLCTESTEAVFEEIVRIEQKREGRTHYGYSAKYKYSVGGIEYSYISFSVESNMDKISTENVIIYYNPSKPNEAYTDIDARFEKTVIKVFKIVGYVLISLGFSVFMLGCYILCVI